MLARIVFDGRTAGRKTARRHFSWPMLHYAALRRCAGKG
jgi:hypothetical protein